MYTLLSSSEQGCEMQHHELRQYVQQCGWQLFAEYVDTGFSCAGHWTAISRTESPLDGTGGQLRQQGSRNKSHNRQQTTEQERREKTATAAAR